MPQQPNNLQIPLQTKRCQWVRKTNDAFRICKKAFCAHAHTFDAGGMVEGAESPGCEPGLRPHGVPLPRLLNFSPGQKHVIFPCFESCHALVTLLGRQFSGNTWQNPLFHLLPCILRSVGQGLFRKCMSDYRKRVLCHANDLEKKICQRTSNRKIHVRFVKRQSCHVYSQSWKSTLSQNTWQEFQKQILPCKPAQSHWLHSMVAGGKAQSAPFCLLSGLCHRAEGKSRAGRSLGSENRKAVGREKEVSGFHGASREAGEVPLLARRTVAPRSVECLKE